MPIVIAIISLFAIASAAWLVNRILPFRICPICAGVSGTWAWMLVAKLIGYEIDMIILAMLMGGTVVGIAYALEKRLPAGRSPFRWKILFIPTGFAAAYSVLSGWWSVALVAILFLAQITLLFLIHKKKNGGADSAMAAIPEKSGSHPMGRKDLEDKMKSCC